MITFRRRTPSGYDPVTDSHGYAESTVTGEAFQVRGDPKQYKAAGLVATDHPTLFFTPTTYGEKPEPGDTVTWASRTYTVKSVQVFQPDGVTMFAYVIVGV